MPQLGETVTEGTITRWLKQVGDPISVDDLLFEVSTDKVDTEVPSAHAGFLREIRVAEGDTVAVGVPLAVITDTADEPLRPTRPPAPLPPHRAPPSPSRPSPGGGGPVGSTARPADERQRVPLARRSPPARRSRPRPGRRRRLRRDGRITRADVLAAAANRRRRAPHRPPAPPPAAVAGGAAPTTTR